MVTLTLAPTAGACMRESKSLLLVEKLNVKVLGGPVLSGSAPNKGDRLRA
jgi:hypothetical protein